MTEREFISWLKGYIQGALPHVQQYSSGEQILECIKERMNDINSEDVKILLDNYDPSRTNFT